MSFTVNAEEARIRCFLLARAGTLAMVLLLMISSACTTVRRGANIFSRKTIPRSGDAFLEGAGTSLPPEASLIGKIDSRTPPQQAASLRLTDDGRMLIESGKHTKALTHLEKTLALDSTNPYVYYYLAKAHFKLANYRQSVDFLDVAESLLHNQPYWMAEVLSLRGENFQAMGLLKEASLSYADALHLNPKNQKAGVGLNRVERAMEVPTVR